MNTTPSNIDTTTGTAVIVGAGQVGTGLARGMTAAGIPVEVAVRNPAETRDELADLTLRPLDAPIADAQCIVLAVPASAIADVVAQLDLIDVTW